MKLEQDELILMIYADILSNIEAELDDELPEGGRAALARWCLKRKPALCENRRLVPHLPYAEWAGEFTVCNMPGMSPEAAFVEAVDVVEDRKAESDEGPTPLCSPVTYAVD
jgi:hypothetical protein